MFYVASVDGNRTEESGGGRSRDRSFPGPRPLFPIVFFLTILTIFAVAPTPASELDFSGYIEVEARYFFNDPLFEGQLKGLQASIAAAPELGWQSESGKHQLQLTAFYRWDDRDEERSHFDLREAYWRYIADRFELTLGFDKVFWGVTESRHLVDIVNQTDLVEDIDFEEKLGQPMVAVSVPTDRGTFALFALTGFRERTFPGVNGRLRFPRPIDTDDPSYESSRGRSRVDWAARWSHYFGPVDIGVSYFDGTSREPRFLLSDDDEKLRPRYDLIRQIGLDLQYTGGPWLWKLEAIARDGHGSSSDSDFQAFVAGFEYTLYQLGGTAMDLGLLAEYLYDNRQPFEAPPTFFEDDVFVGTRLGLNDTQDTSILLGAVVDREDGSIAGLFESERRLGQHWKAQVEARLFTNVDPTNLLATFSQDDYLTLRLARFF